MDYAAVVYRSTALTGLEANDLDHLLVDARAHNQLAGVTGVLLYDGRCFLQYFEGARPDVDRIYARIRASRLHVDLHELQNGPISQRVFHQWYMGCSQVGGSVLQKLSRQQWQHEVDQVSEETAGSPGLCELLRFWEREAAPSV